MERIADGVARVMAAVDATPDGVGCGATRREHPEPIHAVAVADEALQVIEVKPNAVVASRHLRRIRSALHDGGDAHGVADHCARFRREHHSIANAEPRISRESVVDSDRSDTRC